MKKQHRRQMDYQQEGNIEESNTNKEIESLNMPLYSGLWGRD